MGCGVSRPVIAASSSPPVVGRVDSRNMSGSTDCETNRTGEIDIAHGCTTAQEDSGPNSDVGASSTGSLRKFVPRVKYVPIQPPQSPPAATSEPHKGSVDGTTSTLTTTSNSTTTATNAKGVHDDGGNALVEIMNFSRVAQTSYHDSLLGSQPPMPRSTATTIPYGSLSAGGLNGEQIPAIAVRGNDPLDGASSSPLA